MASSTTPMKVVDIHTHMYPPSYIKILESRTTIPVVRSFPQTPDPRLILLASEEQALDEATKDSSAKPPGRPLTSHYASLDQKVHFMNTHKIDISVVSLANPWLDFVDASESGAMAKGVNEEFDAMCAAHPGRLFFFATLPLTASLETILEAVNHVRALNYCRGIILGTSGLGKGLDDPDLLPIFKAIAAARLTIFLHPHYGLPNDVWGPRASNEYGHVLPLALGFPMETTIAVTRMFLAGVFDAVPELRMLLAHSGGTLPFLAGRIESCIMHDGQLVREGKAGKGRRKVWDVLKEQIYLDAVIYSEVGLKAAIDASGADRLMFGTDHPFFPPLTTDEQGEWESFIFTMTAEVRRSNGTRLDASLGITERIASSMTAWTGDMRKRYTDFQVYEINKDGSVLHLKETRLPPPPKDTTPALPPPPPPAPVVEEKKAEEAKTEDAAQNEDKTAAAVSTSAVEKPVVPEIPAEDLAAIASLTNEDFANQLLALYQTISADQNAKTDPATSPIMDDKDQRSQLHQSVRRIFNSAIDTSTDPTGAIVARVVPPRGKGKGTRGGRDNNNNSNKQKKPKARAPGEGEYLHFTMYKENRDTMDALHQISKALRTKPQAIGTAGTKDRRAATTQRCSIRGQRADALVRARLNGVTTGDYFYAPTPIHLGAHAGNEFVIALKDCLVAGSPDLSPADRHAQIHDSVKATMASMHSLGWINYFGHQRFGTHAVGTHEVGRLILQEDFEGAVNAILAYDEAIAKRAAAGEVPEQAHARDDFSRHHACMLFREGGSAEEALKHLPRRFSAESSLIRHLGMSSGPSRRDFTGALTSITRGLRSMYLHAYQSYVWNHAASHRWRLYGEKVVEGDLVFADGSKPQANDAETTQDDDDAEFSDARPLTAEEVASGKYTIHDIVLPSPGHAVVYPTNAVGEFYTTFMRENGGLDPTKMIRRQREFSLRGDYRKVVVRFLAEPGFEVRAYEDDNEQMHPTDMDRIRAARSGAGRKRTRDEAEGQDGDKKKAKTEAALETAPETEAQVGEAMGDEKMEDAPQTEETEPAAGAEAKAEDAAAAAGSRPAAEKTKTAVVVRFQLPKSAYATVALRELMGVDESEVAAVPATTTAAATVTAAAHKETDEAP
ncbi:Multisubstrate pseudouridine synthase 7, partial [Colletotrichum shisoi]